MTNRKKYRRWSFSLKVLQFKATSTYRENNTSARPPLVLILAHAPAPIGLNYHHHECLVFFFFKVSFDLLRHVSRDYFIHFFMAFVWRCFNKKIVHLRRSLPELWPSPHFEYNLSTRVRFGLKTQPFVFFLQIQASVHWWLVNTGTKRHSSLEWNFFKAHLSCFVWTSKMELFETMTSYF